MSPRRFSQHFANLFPVSARPALVALGLFISLAAFASLLLLLSSGPVPVVAAPAEEPQTAVGSPAPVVIAVTMAPTGTTTTITGHVPDPSGCGEAVTVSFRVTPTLASSDNIVGTVTVNDGAGATCSTGVSGNTSEATGSCNLTPTSLGTKTLTATFTPSNPGLFIGSTSAGVSHQVNKGRPTVTLNASPASPQTFGTQVTLMATVAGSCGTPSGHVYFDDNGVVIGTAALNTNGVGTLVVPLLSGGSHLLKAVYESDNDTYLDNESTSQTYVINRRSTTTALVSSANASVFGQTVTFTATVSSGIAFTPTGQVIFRDGGTYLGSATLDGSGRAVFATANLGVGVHPITADYQGDQNFLPSSGNLTQTVSKAATTTGIVDAVRSPSVYGESVTFTAVVSATLPGAGTPTGKVVFMVDGIAKFTAMLGFTNPGEARWMTTPGDSTELDTDPADGDHFITAFYSGDGNFNPSNNFASPFTQRVNKADTSVQLQIPLPETEFGQDVRMTAILSVDQPGAGTPTGTVIFTVDVPDPDIVMTGTLDGTSVTVVTNTIPVGTWDVRAAYGGDDHFNGDTSAAVSHKVNKTDSETTLESSANPSDFGQTITFTATVEAAGIGLFASVKPTRTVTFTLGTVAVVTRTLDGSGVATVVTDTLPAGEHEITAEYSGDGNFKPSDDSLRQTVNTIATTTEISGPTSSAIGDTVTFTATVKQALTATPVPTGTVTFYDGVRVLDTKSLVAGVATLTKSDLSAGLHPLKAVYNGTDDFQASTSGRLYHTVGAVGSTTTLTRSPDRTTVFGESVDFTATVAGSGGTPTGQVTFKDGAATIGTKTLVGGVATLTKADLSAVTHPIKAVYGGDAAFGGSQGYLDHTVDKADTSVDVSSSDTSAVFGQTVVFTATVEVDEAVSTPGAGTPTGSVQFKRNGGTPIPIGSPVPLSGGSASVSTSSLPVGTHTITAEYTNYDGNFEDNTGTMSSDQQVDKADTTTTVTSSPSPSVRDQEVTITAIVTANSPSTATPTGGNVEFDFGDGSPTSSALLVNGTATVSHSYSSATGSPFTITATYLGDGTNFKPSPAGTKLHYVNPTPADLSVTKTDSPDPVNVGDNLTYVINVTNNEAESVDVTLTDTLPPQVSFVSAPGCTHDLSALGGVVTCDLGSLDASGGSASVTIIVKVPLTTPAGTVLSNTAQAGAHSDTEETTVYRSPRRGDCNGDDAVNLADIWAIVRDIFDPTFQGTTGCDANKDRQVDAGDVPSTVLIMLNSPDAGGLGGDLGTVEEGPALALPDQVPAVPGGLVTLPVSFAAHGHSITSLAFSVDYDETWLALDPTDRDGNGIPDAVIFSLPGEFSYSVTFDEGDSDGEVDVFIGDISPPLTSLSDGPIAFMILNVDSPPGETQRAVRFSLDPTASFGDTSGQSVPGTATPGGEHRIYLPVLR